VSHYDSGCISYTFIDDHPENILGFGGLEDKTNIAKINVDHPDPPLHSKFKAIGHDQLVVKGLCNLAHAIKDESQKSFFCYAEFYASERGDSEEEKYVIEIGQWIEGGEEIKNRNADYPRPDTGPTRR
jgi:hypothetical protein